MKTPEVWELLTIITTLFVNLALCLSFAGAEVFRSLHMPNVMIRKKQDGSLLFYVAKKDQEDTIATVQFDTDEHWGGEIELSDGCKYYIEPISPPPVFPTTLRFKRA